MNKVEFKDNQYQEDEIDLRELFKVLLKRKYLILSITFFATLVAVIYTYTIKPTFEVKSNIQVGYIGKNFIIEPDMLVKRLNIVFNIDNNPSTKEKSLSQVTEIVTNKGLKNFIEIKTEALSNDEALKKNKEVVDYMKELYKPKIEQYIKETKYSIDNIKRIILNIDTFEIKNIQEQIRILKENSIAKIDAEIKFLKDFKLKTIDSKINFHVRKLDEYTKSINKLYSNNKSIEDSTLRMISSIQMVNYQNLILNSQNEIEDFKIEKEIILTQTISSLELEKQMIINEQIKKLQYQMNIELVSKKIELNEQIDKLKYSITRNNLRNCEVVGNFIVQDYPIKPKKKLIVVVAFISSFILSIFLVFLLNFIRNEKEFSA